MLMKLKSDYSILLKSSRVANMEGGFAKKTKKLQTQKIKFSGVFNFFCIVEVDQNAKYL